MRPSVTAAETVTEHLLRDLEKLVDITHLHVPPNPSRRHGTHYIDVPSAGAQFLLTFYSDRLKHPLVEAVALRGVGD